MMLLSYVYHWRSKELGTLCNLTSTRLLWSKVTLVYKSWSLFLFIIIIIIIMRLRR